MTDPQTAALQALLERVEAGTLRQFTNLDGAVGHGNGIQARRAYHGSLDAAKALHEAVLPDRAWGITCGGEYGAVATISDLDNGPHRCPAATPARAWLIAILRALIATADTEGR